MSKTVLVTGAAKGLGKSLIKEFASLGYNVVINYLTSEEKAIELKKEMEDVYKIKALTIKADITSDDQIKEMFEEVKDVFGGIDILINNAAYACDSTFKEKTKQEFMRVLEVNVAGTFLMTKYASEYINENGIIMNISSLDATETYNELSIDYCASKAGINSLTKTFALALPNLKVLAVMLPWLNTESIREMNQDFLASELKRTNQTKLLESQYVAKKIIEIINNPNINSGSILKIGE